jgi:single-strand DNA-binding protein
MNITYNVGYISTDLVLQYGKKSNTPFIRFQVTCKRGKSVQFVNFIAWRKQAENIVKFCKKGDQISIEGETVKSQYENDSNVFITVQEIRTVIVTFIGLKSMTLEEDLPVTNTETEGAFYSEEDINF